MSIPFSNTHYRIPRGFANLLEGLTMEVLREQPQDIPHFAAKHFAELLKKREESGFDPADWGAALEDRYYNNHSFQRQEDKPFTARAEDISNMVDGQRSQDLTSSVQENEEEEHKLEDNAVPVPTEDINDGTERVPVLDNSEDTVEPHDRPSSSQSAEVEHKLEDNAVPVPTEDINDGTERVPVLDNSEDTVEPHDRPSSSQSAEVEHKQQEQSDTDDLLREQSATVIQAAFRGLQARGGVRKLKEEPIEKLSPQDYPTSEEAAPHHDEVDLEPHLTDSPQDDSVQVQPDDTEKRPLPDGTGATEDMSGGELVLDKDLDMGQTQDLEEDEEEQKEAGHQNPAVEDEEEQKEAGHQKPAVEDEEEQKEAGHQKPAVEDEEEQKEAGHQKPAVEDEEEQKEAGHQNPAVEDEEEQKEAGHQNPAVEDEEEQKEAGHQKPAVEDEEEQKEAGHQKPAVEDEEEQKEAGHQKLAVEDQAEDHDGQQTHEEEDQEDNIAVKDVEGQDTTQTQDHREEDKVDNITVESQGPKSTASPETPDTSVTHEAVTTEGQQESPDNETVEQLEDKSEEPADAPTNLTAEQQEDREENEALRKQTDEALDIALDDPDANAAAAKIQAGFRGHMTRKKMKSGDKDVKHKEGKEGSSAQGD